MSNLAIGTAVFTFFGVVIAFFIAAALLRWIFAIRKIVDLLGVIAQELRASNAVQEIDAKLKEKGIGDQLAKYLNNLVLKQYKAPAEGQIRPPLSK